MATIDPVIVKLQADVSDLKSGLEKAQASLKGLDDSVKRAESSFAGFGTKVKQLGATLGVTFAATQIVSFFKESVAAAQQAEAAQARLATLLRNTNDATDEQIAALTNQAKALEKVGVVSADNITVAQSQLATFDLSAAAIEKLTPAVLNYVTAEKGASASADEFKSMSNSLAQALQGNFASLTKVGFVLDDTTKKQISQGTEMERAAALTNVLNSTYDEFNEKLRLTSEGLKQVALNDFNNLKQQIGEGLQPVMDNLNKFLVDTLFPALSKFTKFLVDNKETIMAVTKVLLTGVAAFAAYKAAIVIASVASTAFQVVMTILKGAQLATIASTNGLAASMLKLNAVMKANPIGAFITIATAAVAIIVALWKNSETFRSIVITVGKTALNAFAAVIPMVAQLAETILKTATGPLRLILLGLSKIPGVGKYAKAGLDMFNQGLDSISDLGVKASAKAQELTKKLDELAKSAKKAGKDTKDAVTGDAGEGLAGGGGIDEKTQKKVDALKEKLKGYYDDWAKMQRDAQDKFIDAQERFNERVADAQATYQDRVTEANERFNDSMASAQERYNERVADAYARRDEQIENARQRFTQTVLNIENDYNSKMMELAERLAEQQQELRQRAEEKRQDLRKRAAEQEEALTKQSIDRLRSAFASGLGINLADEFKKGGGAKGIVDALKEKLTGAKELQKNAAALAAKGYSQTFIEQIVKEGPKVGNEMAKALLESSPEATAEMQSLYGQLETITDSGLDSLATTMNQGGNLATAELRKAYTQISTDLKNALALVDVELQIGLARAQDEYNKAVVRAAMERDRRLREAYEALQLALLAAEEELQKALVKLQKELEKAQKEAKERLDKELADAQDKLQDALFDAQKAFDKAVDAINKSMTDKLDDLLRKIAEVQAALQKLGSTSPNPPLPKYSGFSSTPSSPIIPSKAAAPEEYTNINNITINQNTQTDPQLTADAIVNAIKYGQVIEVTREKIAR